MDQHETLIRGRRSQVSMKAKKLSIYKDAKPVPSIRTSSLQVNRNLTSINEGGLERPASSLAVLAEEQSTGLSSPIGNLHYAPDTRDVTRSVLTNNTVKVNSPPTSRSSQSLDKVLKDAVSSTRKRHADSEEHELNTRSAKSPRLRRPSLRINSSHITDDVKQEPALIGPHGEPPPSGIEAKPSKFHEGSMNDRVSKLPPLASIGEVSSFDAMEIDTSPLQGSFSDFSAGIEKTPRASPMYNFGTTMRSLNPFKAMGSLFSRSSKPSTPTTLPPTLANSDQVARQVEQYLQQYEKRMSEKWLAFQQATKMKEESEIQEGLTLLQTPDVQIMPPSQDYYKLFMENSTDSPVIRSQLESAAESSPTLPTPQSDNVSIHPNHVEQLRESGPKSPNLLATMFRSPTKVGTTLRRSTITGHRNQLPSLASIFASRLPQNLSPEKQDESFGDSSISLDRQSDDTVVQGQVSTVALAVDTERSSTKPQLKHKASQHIKKMTSMMSLNNRKTKCEEITTSGNESYHLMKKKPKNQILNEYMALQKENKELEKKLQERAQQSRESIHIPALNAEPRCELGTGSTELVLSELTTPKLHSTKRKSESPSLEEQTPAKRQMTFANKKVLPTGLEVQNDHDNSHDLRRSQRSTARAAQENWRGQFDSMKKLSGNDSNGQSVAETVGKHVPPIPEIPSKFRSKVPKATRGSPGKTAGKEDEGWKGWDEDVF